MNDPAAHPGCAASPESPAAGAPAADTELSVIIPAWNESRRIAAALIEVDRYAAERSIACEVVVVDDGSTDGTAQAARAAAVGVAAVRVLVHERNLGKGAAVRRGMLAAVGRLRLMCDADLSTPMSELDRLRPWVEAGYGVVIGSRDLPDSRVERAQPWLRRGLAWGFRLLRRAVLLPGVRDTQCGFKLFTAAAAEALFGRATEDGWLFDCEVLALAQRLGIGVREVGVVWHDDRDSRVSLGREIVLTVGGLMRIRRRMGRTDLSARPGREAEPRR